MNQTRHTIHHEKTENVHWKCRVKVSGGYYYVGLMNRSFSFVIKGEDEFKAKIKKVVKSVPLSLCNPVELKHSKLQHWLQFLAWRILLLVSEIEYCCNWTLWKSLWSTFFSRQASSRAVFSVIVRQQADLIVYSTFARRSVKPLKLNRRSIFPEAKGFLWRS